MRSNHLSTGGLGAHPAVLPPVLLALALPLLTGATPEAARAAAWPPSASGAARCEAAPDTPTPTPSRPFGLRLHITLV